MSLLQLREVAVSFGGVQAVAGVSLTVERGGRHAVIGPNGAGKTTLFHIVSGHVRPSAGRVVFAGEDVTLVPSYRRARRGLARTFQITNLFPKLTVLDNLLLALQRQELRWSALLRPLHRDRALYAEAERLLAGWELDRQARLPVAALSYGAQRKLEILLAVARGPRLLLLDEPAAGMDDEDTARLAARLKSLSHEMTLLFIEHDLEMTFAVATTVTVMHQGRIIAAGDPATVRQDERVKTLYFGTP